MRFAGFCFVVMGFCLHGSTAIALSEKVDTPPSTRPAAPPPSILIPDSNGTILKVDPVSITISELTSPTATTKPAQRTFTIDENTKVLAPQVAGTRPGPNGQVIRMVTFAAGTTADLQAAQQVRIRADGDIASVITILMPMVSRSAMAMDRGGAVPVRVATTRPATTRPMTGRIVKIGAESITIASVRVPVRGAGGTPGAGPGVVTTTELTYKIDANTKVAVRVTRERLMSQGQPVMQSVLEPASASDLHVGQRVSIIVNGNSAATINIVAAPATRPAR